jgi:hypothetical protein
LAEVPFRLSIYVVSFCCIGFCFHVLDRYERNLCPDSALSRLSLVDKARTQSTFLSNIRTPGAKLMSNVVVPGSRRSNQPYLGNEKIIKTPACGTARTVNLPHMPILPLSV